MNIESAADNGVNRLEKPFRTTRKIFCVDRKEIHFFRYTLESYDGMAVVSTLDSYEALIEVAIAPGCENMVLEILHAMSQQEQLRISESRIESATRTLSPQRQLV